MSYLILSYHISKLGADNIGQLNWQSSKVSETLKEWKKELPFEEVLYLATCNRVEFLFYSKDTVKLMEKLPSLMPVDTDGARYYSEPRSVIQHLLEVGLSIDSLVFGENQILGQLKTAYQTCLKERLCSSHISILIQNILKHSKSIRTQNHMSNIHNTISTVAAKDFLIHKDTDLPVLLVGAGESNQILARYLSKRDVKNFIWTNRTNERAKKLTSEIGGEYIAWENFLEAQLPEIEACFLTTNAGEEIFLKNHLLSSKVRRVYDLSIPANASAEMVHENNRQYIGIEVLELILSNEIEKFEKLKTKVSQDIQLAANNILEHIEIRQLNPIISESLDNIDKIVNGAMEKLPTDLKHLGQDQLEALRVWTRSIVQKTKHEHITQLKKLNKK